MRQVWQCQFCGEVFLDQISCSEHEEQHCTSIVLTNQRYSVGNNLNQNKLPDRFDLECVFQNKLYRASYTINGDISQHSVEEQHSYGIPLMYKSRYAR